MTRGTMAHALLLLMLTAAASAAPSDVPNADIPRIRTADVRLRSLITEGSATSPTFRALVDRLQQSDVVVYVQCDPQWSSRQGGGRLTFVSSAGGFRYVVVRMGWLPSRAQQIAMLAHELQHAAEIAGTPAIVDAASLAREYRRMAGAREVSRPGPSIAFDTDAANAAGETVLLEINRSDRRVRSSRSDRSGVVDAD